jgi:hypothetical protein
MQFNLKKNAHLYELFMRQLKEIAGRYTQFYFSSYLLVEKIEVPGENHLPAKLINFIT